MYIKKEKKVNPTGKELLLNESRMKFILHLLEKAHKEYHHPNVLAWRIGIQSTILYRCMTGTEPINRMSLHYLLKILNYFGYDLKITLEPLKAGQKKLLDFWQEEQDSKFIDDDKNPEID